MANEINFDFAGAEAAGLSRQDIIKEIEKSGKVKFDFTGARKAGISDDDIYTELSSRGIQPPSEEVDIIPGPPEGEFNNGLTGDVSVGEVTVEPIEPALVQNIDTKTTEPSAPMYNQEGKLTTGIASQMEANREQVLAQGQELANRQGFATIVDPITGEKNQLTEGGIEPDYPMLVGTRLGVFGGPGMLGDSAMKVAAETIGKKSAEVAEAIDELFKSHKLAELAPALSKEAKYILNRNPNISENEVVQALQGVKTADQAYALSRMLGETGYIRQAVRAEGDAAAGALRADLEVARDKILQTVGNVDITHAKAKYADMVQAIAGDYKNVHNATPILEDLDFLERFYGVTPSAGNRVVTQMKATLAENPNINLSDALEFRGDLNYLIGKATRGREKVKLNQIKENLDSFISKVATPEQKTMIDDAVSTYASTMQNRDVLELVSKNTKDGIAVNWTKLHRDLNEANLRSPEAVDALRIAEAFSKRFGNDKKLLSTALPAGSSPDSGGVLGAWGYVINHLKDTLAIYGNRAENLKIQKAILKSIKSGTTNLDFVNKLKANGDVPEEVSKIFEDVLQIPYKAGARQTGDVNLEPIVTPVGGTEKVVPKATEEMPTQSVVDTNDLSDRILSKLKEKPEQLPISNELQVLTNSMANNQINKSLQGGITIKPSDNTMYPQTLGFGHINVPIKIRGNQVSVDTIDFKNGSGLGKKFYDTLWEALDKNNLEHRPEVLTGVNQIRLPINALAFKQKTGKFPPISGGPKAITTMVSEAVDILNNELKGLNLPELDKINAALMPKVVDILGKRQDIRVGTNSLKLYIQAARKLKGNEVLSIGTIMPFINAAYEEGED